MDWLHLPIADVSVPGPDFEARWVEVGEGLRARLRDGFDVLVHCKGGLGRAGTIAARLLIELGGTERRGRPPACGLCGRHYRDARAAGLCRASAALCRARALTTAEAIRDRARGCPPRPRGGRCVGTTLEFKPRDSYAPLTDMVGGGPFGLRPGEWTDDTAMALALADSSGRAPGPRRSGPDAPLHRVARAGHLLLHGHLLRHRHHHTAGALALEEDRQPRALAPPTQDGRER
jgi:ADP-ribosyl-[dinitrogen reductase] hydrolase